MGKQSHFGHLLAKDCLESWLHQVGIVHGKSAWLYCLKSVAVVVCVSEGGSLCLWRWHSFLLGWITQSQDHGWGLSLSVLELEDETSFEKVTGRAREESGIADIIKCLFDPGFSYVVVWCGGGNWSKQSFPVLDQCLLTCNCFFTIATLKWIFA